ncbi:FecR family protein [Arcicella aurantiaca]|uniref:FecR family protein n=1 Tax=Arcicella aurantiaca TaxID=591202 RepID=A0A316EE53_9BACT|nr:FecR family protein [Arcicella aurantiaca]PWK27650.1 FecR family protein [Arcicella aurantiaca]
MSKIQFKTILENYLKGTCSEQERKLVEQWYELLDEDHQVLFPSLSLDDLERELWEKVKMKSRLPENVNIRPIRWYQQNNFYRVAAGVMILIGVGGYFWQNQSDSHATYTTISKQYKDFVHHENNTLKEEKVLLPDGSIVTLSAKSSIDYPEKWAIEKREVFLEGDAFFEVKRNPKQPFLVYANEIVTKVLGTSFWVKATNPNNQVEVAVVTGKVSVFKQDTKADYISKTIKSGVILTPNQQVSYFPENKVFVTGIVKNPVLIQPEPLRTTQPTILPSFKYDETTIAEVLKDLEKAYGIEIIVENEHLTNCPLTADLSESNLYTKLDIICATLKATYEVRGTKILISGKGC